MFYVRVEICKNYNLNFNFKVDTENLHYREIIENHFN